jgi:hypothetical protein
MDYFMRKKIFFLFTFVFLLVQTLCSVESMLSVYAQVDKQVLSLNEQAVLKFVVVGQGFFPLPELPKINGFFVHQSAQYTKADFSTGKPIPYTVYAYILSPLEKGKYIIPPIYVFHKGINYATKEIPITVQEKALPIPSKQKEIPSDIVKPPQEALKYINSPVFVISEISKKNILYNQHVIYTYTFFTSVSMIRLPDIVFPEYEAFHREPLDYRRIYKTKIGDTLYLAIEFKCALFPYMTDEQTIPGVILKFNKKCFSDEVLKTSGLSKYLEKQNYFAIQSNDIKTNISPLPLQDKPLNFSGLIGEFEISADIDKDLLKEDDYLVLTVTIRGTGNIMSIPDIEAPLLEKFRDYQNDTFLNYDKRKDRVYGEKLFRIVYVPTATGQDEIPPIGFSYFDEKENKYVTKWTEAIPITILEKEATIKLKKEIKRQRIYSSIGLFLIIIAVIIILRIIKKRKNTQKLN